MFKVKKEDDRTMSLTCSGALIVNLNYISCFAFSIVLIVNFEHVMPIGIVNKITSTVKTTNYILTKLSINLD